MTRPLDELLGSLDASEILPDPLPEPTFSVIVRTQGTRPDSLGEALASLAAQTMAPTETLVMVHPTENTDEVAGNRVANLLSESGEALPSNWRTIAVDPGPRSRPLNAGLDAATSEYVTFLDDDDLAMPTWIEAFARGAASHPERSCEPSV
jgi:glycosyltransferase involved in cell wall biosynthesis